MTYPSLPIQKSKSLTEQVVDLLSARVSSGQIKPGEKLPAETEIMHEMGVSRTVVREAISRLLAGGWVETRRGIGTFACQRTTAKPFALDPSRLHTLQDLVAALELRISLESETAGLAAARRTPANLKRMRDHLNAFKASVENLGTAVNPDFNFHLEIARATENRYFVEMLTHLGATVIPRARLDTAKLGQDEQTQYLARVDREHESIYDAIAGQDVETARLAMRMHLSNSRERLRRAFENAKGKEIG